MYRAMHKDIYILSIVEFNNDPDVYNFYNGNYNQYLTEQY